MKTSLASVSPQHPASEPAATSATSATCLTPCREECSPPHGRAKEVAEVADVAPPVGVRVAKLAAPVTSGNPGSGAKDGQGGVKSRTLASAPYARFCARPKAAGVPVEAAVGAGAGCPTIALGPPSSRSPNTPTGNT